MIVELEIKELEIPQGLLPRVLTGTVEEKVEEYRAAMPKETSMAMALRSVISISFRSFLETSSKIISSLLVIFVHIKT